MTKRSYLHDGLTQAYPGKFEGWDSAEWAEIVYGASTGGWTNEEGGECDRGGWYGLMLDFDIREAVRQFGEDVCREFGHPNKASLYGWLNLAYSEVKAIVVSEDNQGFFSWSGFTSNEKAQAAFDKWVAEQEEALDEDEEETA